MLSAESNIEISSRSQIEKERALVSQNFYRRLATILMHAVLMKKEITMPTAIYFQVMMPAKVYLKEGQVRGGVDVAIPHTGL